MPTNTEKIDALMRSVTEVDVILKERSVHFRRDIDAQRSDIGQIEEAVLSLAQKTSSLEERIKSLEKSSDRSWQIVPILVSLAALAVAIYVAFLKK